MEIPTKKQRLLTDKTMENNFDLKAYFKFTFEEISNTKIVIRTGNLCPKEDLNYELGKSLVVFLQSLPLILSIQFRGLDCSSNFWLPVFAFLTTNPYLHSVEFYLITIDGSILPLMLNFILQNRRLKKLVLYHCLELKTITEKKNFLAVFCQNTTLEDIFISDNFICDNRFFKRYYNNNRVDIPALTNLSLTNNSSSIYSFDFINQPVGQNLRLLHLSAFFYSVSHTQSFYNLLVALSVNTTLTSLDISHNDYSQSTEFPDPGDLGSALALHPTLTCLNMDHIKISSDFKFNFARNLAHNTALTTLLLNPTKTDDFLSVLADSLIINTTLTDLNLGWETPVKTFFDPIARVIKYNTTLQSLHLPSLILNQTEFFQPIGDAISHNNVLTRLRISSWLPNFSSHSIKQWARLNETLEELNLSVLYGNSEPQSDLSWVGEFLTQTKSLKRLNLERCNISETGMDAIVEGLIENDSLEYVNFTDNHVTGEHIHRILCHNQHLKSLFVQGSRSMILIKLVLEGLKQNRSVELFDMRHSMYSNPNEPLQLLGEVFLVNTTISKLYLPPSIVTFDANSEFCEKYLRYNTTVTHQQGIESTEMVHGLLKRNQKIQKSRQRCIDATLYTLLLPFLCWDEDHDPQTLFFSSLK